MRIIFLVTVSILFTSGIFAQHPNRYKIDSLKKLLPSTKGIARIECLNALSEEYWWFPKVLPDSISCWAIPAHHESVKINYDYGLATSIMHLGVAEIYRKNFLTAEKYLRQALGMFEIMKSDIGLGWCNVWLGQALYSENSFKESIDCYRRSIPFLERLGSWEGKGKAWGWLGFLYAATGDYDSSFEYCTKSLLIRQKSNDYVCVAGSLTNMGHLYKVAGDYEDALDYYRQGLQYANTHEVRLHASNWNYFEEPLGLIYMLMNKPDSSFHYLQQAIQIDPANQMTQISLGESFFLKKEYDSALNIFLKPIQHYSKENDRWDLMRILLDIAKIYDIKNNRALALKYATESFSIAKSANFKLYMMEGYQLLSKIYRDLGNNDTAYVLLKQYSLLKDSMVNKQLVWRMSNYKKNEAFKKQHDQVILLNDDNRIKENKLKQASQLQLILITGLLFLALSGFIIYRYLTLKRKNEKLENQKVQSDLQLKATELEMQALRAQMNPHFIFNCLSSINRFILKNETEAASDYLTKFSRLIRMALTNSNKPFITLEDELDMLKLYLDMERLRFKNLFNYNIIFINAVDAGNIFIPPLLLQPFAENAIWHGLMHKEGLGKLEITLSLDEKILTCIISDNGIGRSKAAMYKSKSAEKQKSMGIQMTKERLALLNMDTDEKTFFNVEDITNEEGNVTGTRVILKMNYKSLMETYA